MRIAIADDERDQISLLQNMLSMRYPEAEILAFDEAQELEKAIGRISFDIAFLDLFMPYQSGIDLAKKMLQYNERTNIIFVTGHDGYQAQAMELFASGYVLKPVTPEKIKAQMEHLRYPVKEKKRVFVQTFGNFPVFVDGKPIKFTREKSQMVFAFLIHRRGSLVNIIELSMIIFDDGVYDKNRKSYLSKLCWDVIHTFEKLGLPDLIVRTPTALAVNRDSVDCDLYDYLDRKPNVRLKYQGEYMNQYSFGEEMITFLNKRS